MDYTLNLLRNIYPYNLNPPVYMRDVSNLRSDIVTFFFQGNASARSQAALYTGPEGVSVIYNGDEIHSDCSVAPRLLHNVWTYPELQDVIYTPYNPVLWIGKLINSVKNRYLNLSGSPSHAPYITLWNVAGEGDVMQYLYHFRQMLQNCPSEKKIVLFGCSRGAATTFIAVSKMTPDEQDRIALVIVEAPFDSVPDVLTASALLPQVQLRLLSSFTLYSDCQMSPLQAAETFPLNIPVAFITSNTDTRVPPQCTDNLINKLKERGHSKIHRCELQNSHHSLYPLHNESDQKTYYDFVEFLYNTYT